MTGVGVSLGGVVSSGGVTGVGVSLGGVTGVVVSLGGVTDGVGVEVEGAGVGAVF